MDTHSFTLILYRAVDGSSADALIDVDEPAYSADTRPPLWRWSDAATWLDPDTPRQDRDRIVGLVNATLTTRQYVHSTDDIQAIESLLAAS